MRYTHCAASDRRSIVEGFGFFAQKADLLRQRRQRFAALLELPGGGLCLDALEQRSGGDGSHVGTSAFAVVCQVHTPLGIACPNGIFDQRNLLRGVVDQGGEDLLHEARVVESDVAKLLYVERDGRVDGLHASIVRCCGVRRNRTNPLERAGESPNPVREVPLLYRG